MGTLERSAKSDRSLANAAPSRRVSPGMSRKHVALTPRQRAVLLALPDDGWHTPEAVPVDDRMKNNYLRRLAVLGCARRKKRCSCAADWCRCRVVADYRRTPVGREVAGLDVIAGAEALSRAARCRDLLVDCHTALEQSLPATTAALRGLIAVMVAELEAAGLA